MQNLINHFNEIISINEQILKNPFYFFALLN